MPRKVQKAAIAPQPTTPRLPQSTSDSGQKTQTTLLVIALLLSVFANGALWTKVQFYEKGTPTPSAKQADTTTGQTAALPKAPTVSKDTIKSLFTDKHVYFGDKNSKNLFVEVADPSCPYCHVAAGQNGQLNKDFDKQSGRQRFTLVADGGPYVAPIPEMKKLVEAGKAAFVYIYFPGHGNGEMGTKALFCANEKGKFWQVHDKLMTNEGYTLLNNTIKNDKTKSSELASFLADVFNQNEMKQCVDSGKYDSRLTEDTTAGSSLGINGTPGFFINTTNFAGAYSWNEMKSAVQ